MPAPKISFLQLLLGTKNPNVLLTMVSDWQKLYEQEKQINDRIKKNYSFFRPVPFLPFLYIKVSYTNRSIAGHKAQNRIKRWWQIFV